MALLSFSTFSITNIPTYTLYLTQQHNMIVQYTVCYSKIQHDKYKTQTNPRPWKLIYHYSTQCTTLAALDSIYSVAHDKNSSSKRLEK